MLAHGEGQKEVIRPDVNRAIMIDSHGAKITSDADSLLVRGSMTDSRSSDSGKMAWKT
jgi:hypothetical protein